MKIIAGVLIAAVLAFGSGCARSDWIERTLVTVDVTGVWQGSMSSWDGQPAINEEVSLELKQQGPNVTGHFQGRRPVGFWRQSGPIEGSVAGDVFRFNETSGSITGELTVSGDERSDNGLRQAARHHCATSRFIAARPGSPTR